MKNTLKILFLSTFLVTSCGVQKKDLQIVDGSKADGRTQRAGGDRGVCPRSQGAHAPTAAAAWLPMSATVRPLLMLPTAVQVQPALVRLK